MKFAVWISVFVFLTGSVLGFAGEARYISLAPSTTEILFSLGLNAEIVGVSSYCNYPSEAALKDTMGDFSRPNIEKIVSLKPDYIFCTGLEQVPVIQELKRLHIKVCVSDPKSMDELLESILEIGRITGREKEAGALVEGMSRELKEVQSRVASQSVTQKPKVFIEFWKDPLMTAGKGTFIDEVIRLAGGENIAYDTQREYSIFSPEEVIRRNPDWIILAYMSKDNPVDGLKKRFGWSGINAIRKNQIIADINPDILLRPGPRVVVGLKELNKKLYP